MASGGGVFNPPKWDLNSKDFSLWLKEVEAWKLATVNVSSLKNTHGLQLALGLPEDSEVRQHVFNTLKTEELAGETGWVSILNLENSEAFETWKIIRSIVRKDNETIDDYIMRYEKCKMKMIRYKMDIGERVHGYNLLCRANLSMNDLRISMREIDNKH